MVSYRSTASYKRDRQLTDWQKTQRIISALEKKGYVTEDLPVSVPDAWKPYIQSETAETEDGKKRLCRYLSAPYGAVQINQAAPDFSPPDCVEEYLAKPGYVRTVCRQHCPIMCSLYPRIFLSKRTSPCFMLFVLHRPSD